MAKKITIKEIAENAAVSISTVSRVMNNNGTVDQTKREAVLKAMAELKYQPNALARGLVRGQTNTIGVLTQDIGSKFNDTIARGAMIGLRESGYSSVVVDGRWNKNSEEEAFQNLFERRVDGIVLIGTSMDEKRLNEISETMPVFLLCHELPSWAEKNLFFDNMQGAYMATNHLIKRGHRDIALITGVRGRQETERRIEGYQKALFEADLEMKTELLFESDFLAPSGIVAVESLLSRGVNFSAIFCANDEVAFGCRLALSNNGMRVPDDISLVGFDDHPLSAFMMPPLTTVKQPAYEMGYQASQALIAMLEDKSFELPKIEPELIIRKSVGQR